MFSKLGELQVEIRANLNKFKTDLGKAQAAVKRAAAVMKTALVAAFTAIAAAGAAAVVGINKLASSIDVIGKEAKRLGFTAEAFQEISQAARLSGVTIEEVRTGMAAFTRQLGSAEEGNQAAIKSFKDLEAASGRSIDTSSRQAAFKSTLLALADVSNETERATLSLRLFGEAGQRMLPMLQEGSTGLEGLWASARKLGLVVNNETVAALDRDWETFSDPLPRIV
jgi:phage-related minor tail protein